jgi:hypothetical protein
MSFYHHAGGASQCVPMLLVPLTQVRCCAFGENCFYTSNRIASQTIAAFRCLAGAKYMKNSRDFSFSRINHTSLFLCAQACDTPTHHTHFGACRGAGYPKTLVCALVGALGMWLECQWAGVTQGGKCCGEVAKVFTTGGALVNRRAAPGMASQRVAGGSGLNNRFSRRRVRTGPF